MYYLCRENKDADQLRGYREADLRLFSHMQNVGFLMTRLYNNVTLTVKWKVQVVPQSNDIAYETHQVEKEFFIVHCSSAVIKDYNYELRHGEPAFCKCENKGADQLRGNCVADQLPLFSPHR